MYSASRQHAFQEDLNLLFGKITAQKVKALTYLQRLLRESEHARSRKQYGSFAEEKDEINQNAAVFLCWYSQLRELITVHPHLASRIKVCALPGGGFSGDWYLGISKGSVSVELGKEIIEMLSSPQEQYKRLLAGVGLPVLKSFQRKNTYLAWPHADGVWLNEIYNIHENANTRIRINKYFEVRSKLAVKCGQLIVDDQTTS
jgi:hypothetical protein